MNESASSPSSKRAIELTILMPCLDEAETLETCIRKARRFIDSSGVSAEIVLASFLLSILGLRIRRLKDPAP